MVTSKFYREYFQLSDDIVSLNSFIGTTIEMPLYSFNIEKGIYNVEEYLNNLVELEDGSIVEDNPFYLETSKVRYLNINLSEYCYYYDSINEFYQDKCDQDIDDESFSRYFESVDEYIDYIDGFKEQVNKIDPNYFDILFRSGAIYFVIDENETNGYIPPFDQFYIERVYRALYDEASLVDGLTYFEDGIFKEQLSTKEMLITGIIENDNESIVYMDFETYNKLFSSTPTVVIQTGYYSINLASGINKDFAPVDIALEYFAYPLNSVSKSVQNDYKIIRKENIEQGEVCSIYDIDNIINSNSDFEEVPLLGDVFNLRDYSSCMINTESYHYLTSIRILFGVFFNVLMFISIVFFNILLQVILSERIGEIGVYRSVGSTSKDIKILFFMEIVFEIVLASVLSIIIIYYANDVINDVFLDVINQGSGVINFAGMKLSIGDSASITNISFFNLLFYIVVVFILLGFLSNRNVSKLANTKPIDILREVD